MIKVSQAAWWSLAVIAFAGALAGCAGQRTITASPETFAIPENMAKLRAPQSITLKNGYSSETMLAIGPEESWTSVSWSADMRQLTDVAIEMTSRFLAKNGITVGSGEKTVTLRVRDVRSTIRHVPFATRVNTTLNLAVQMGDGTESLVPAENGSPQGASRAMSGALLFAVSGMLNDAHFVDYVNR